MPRPSCAGSQGEQVSQAADYRECQVHLPGHETASQSLGEDFSNWGDYDSGGGGPRSARRGLQEAIRKIDRRYPSGNRFRLVTGRGRPHQFTIVSHREAQAQTIMEEIILFAYIFSLTVLFVFGSHGFIMIYYYLKFRSKKSQGQWRDHHLSPGYRPASVYNEIYVVGRLIDAVLRDGLSEGQAGDPGPRRFHRSDGGGGGRVRGKIPAPGIRHQAYPPVATGRATKPAL